MNLRSPEAKLSTETFGTRQTTHQLANLCNTRSALWSYRSVVVLGCISNCQQCSDTTTCDTCNDGFFVDSNNGNVCTGKLRWVLIVFSTKMPTWESRWKSTTTRCVCQALNQSQGFGKTASLPIFSSSLFVSHFLSKTPPRLPYCHRICRPASSSPLFVT